MCSRACPFLGSSLRMRKIVGCGPPNPPRGPISMQPSARRSSSMKSRTSHQNRASTSGSRHLSTSSLIRHAIETCSQRGDCRGGRRRTSRVPCGEDNRDRTGRGEQGRTDLGAALLEGLLTCSFAGLPADRWRGLLPSYEGQRGGGGVPDRGTQAAGSGCPGQGGPAAQPDGRACAGTGQGRGAGLAAGDRPGGSHAGAGAACQRGAAWRACTPPAIPPSRTGARSRRSRHLTAHRPGSPGL